MSLVKIVSTSSIFLTQYKTVSVNKVSFEFPDYWYYCFSPRDFAAWVFRKSFFRIAFVPLFRIVLVPLIISSLEIPVSIKLVKKENSSSRRNSSNIWVSNTFKNMQSLYASSKGCILIVKHLYTLICILCVSSEALAFNTLQVLVPIKVVVTQMVFYVLLLLRIESLT